MTEATYARSKSFSCKHILCLRQTFWEKEDWDMSFKGGSGLAYVGLGSAWTLRSEHHGSDRRDPRGAVSSDLCTRIYQQPQLLCGGRTWETAFLGVGNSVPPWRAIGTL